MSYGSGSGGYGGGAPGGGASTSNSGTIVLVLGILGVIGCGICAPIAWIMGNSAAKTLGGDPQQANLANIGKILGIIGTVLTVLGIIGYSIFIASALSAAKNSPRSTTAPSSY
ncbi:MAG: hypothetical protein H7Z41_10855 [Cytophagales bacterium]|nr:hypothetical protein [Armatimonadota bacterium]